MNYVFCKFSTNSNVNGYEVDNLPIPKEIPKTAQVQIKNVVNNILAIKKENSKADTENMERHIDQIIYDLYDLADDEIAIIKK